MSELARRGHDELVSVGLTRAQRQVADARAHELKISVVHAKNEKEEAALLRDRELRKELEARRLKAAETQRQSNEASRRIASAAAAAKRRDDLPHSSAPCDESGRQADPTPPRVHVPLGEAATRNSDTPALLKFKAWVDAIERKDPDADRLAYLVAVDASAKEIAERRLKNDAFERLKAASSRHRHQLQMQQRQTWSMGI